MNHYTVLSGVAPQIRLHYSGQDLDDALYAFFQLCPEGKNVLHHKDTLAHTDPQDGRVTAMLIGITEREWATFCFEATAHVVAEGTTKQ